MLCTDNRHIGTYKCRDKELVIGRKTLIMGILNCTPDSFSDGGRYTDIKACLMQAENMIEAGCDVIDIGGEATNPKAEPVTSEEEISRIVPVIKELRDRYDIPLSADTCKSAVARAALDCGCDIINDVTGFMGDPEMAKTAASYGAGVILMFNSRTNGAAEDDQDRDIIERAEEELSRSIEIALSAGIPDDHIITDPGIGFGTSREQDGILTRNLLRLGFDGRYPVLYAASRKRYVKFLSGKADTNEDELDRITADLSVTAAALGAAMVRVHDVAGSRLALNAFDSFYYHN